MHNREGLHTRFVLCMQVRRRNAINKQSAHLLAGQRLCYQPMTIITETLGVIPPIPKGFREFATMREGR